MIHISFMNLRFKQMSIEIRSCYSIAVYVKNDLNCTKIPNRCNFNKLKITIMVPNIHVIGIQHSKTKVTISQLIDALSYRHNSVFIEPAIPAILLGNLMQANTEQKTL